MFLEFYFNEQTGTIAFALIRDQGKIWGIDRDNIRGWHLHPLENPMGHVGIEKLSVSEIVERLRAVLKDWADQMSLGERGQEVESSPRRRRPPQLHEGRAHLSGGARGQRSKRAGEQGSRGEW